mmetsp:Transcript_49012/g.127940  ORF Transcript_49012/g.127940 Transcript_49012/m.127940 type:complete len:272 (+) Transcript_49012:367-1182(+)
MLAGTLASSARSLWSRRSFVRASGVSLATAADIACALAAAVPAVPDSEVGAALAMGEGSCAEGDTGMPLGSAEASMAGSAALGACAMSLRELAAISASTASRACSCASTASRAAASLAESAARLLSCTEPQSGHLVRRTWSSTPQPLQGRIQILRAESGDAAGASASAPPSGDGAAELGTDSHSPWRRVGVSRRRRLVPIESTAGGVRPGDWRSSAPPLGSSDSLVASIGDNGDGSSAVQIAWGLLSGSAEFTVCIMMNRKLVTLLGGRLT